MAAPARHELAIDCKPWLQRLGASLPLARAGRDPEGVHQLRVAIARLRVWLRLADVQVLRDDLKWLRDCGGAIRDLDVQLQLDPPAALVRRLQAARPAAQRALLEALDNPRAGGLLEAFSLLPPIERGRAQQQLARLARTALRRGRHAYARPHDLPSLHALRRAARRLRFALEWLGHRPRQVIALQSALGAVGDRALMLRALDAMGRDAGPFQAYRHRIERELRRHARDARQLWLQAQPAIERWAASTERGAGTHD